MDAALVLSRQVGVKPACEALDVSRATLYRKLEPKDASPDKRPDPPLSLKLEEKQMIMDQLHSERFMDKAPYQVYAELLDEGTYLCSIRTMYRLLTDCHGDVKERRRQVVRPHYAKPELLATGPNQLWSWDITKLKGPVKWTYYYLYVVIDVFSRYVVGWMVASRELASLAKQLIEQACINQNIPQDQLTIHSDRGSAMTSKTVAQLLADLGVVRSLSRPHVSNDNPFSEAQFKTVKYCPQFPDRFGCLEDSRSFCRPLLTWYNTEHRHSGIGLMTPEQVHYGLAPAVYDNRCKVLNSAFDLHPERFKGKMPTPPDLPVEVWINKPSGEK